MHVELINHSPISTVVKAIRKCYESEGRSDSVVVAGEFILGARDKELIAQIVSSGHLSTVEHAVYTFDIDDISRGCLQEFARHRIASLSVKSTRYTLGRIKTESSFLNGQNEPDLDLASKYLVSCNDDDVNRYAAIGLEFVRRSATRGVPNDQLKYCLPESFKTSLVWTINARALRNFLDLRLNPRAHWEIRELANKVLLCIPKDHLILFRGIA